MKKRNLIEIVPGVELYQNGHPTNWFVESREGVVESVSLNEAVERLIDLSITRSIQLSNSADKLSDASNELKSVIDAMRSAVSTWYQLQIVSYHLN